MTSKMIHDLLYAFKRQWGGEFQYVQILTSQADTTTGTRDISRQVFNLPAVKLPIQTLRKFIQDIGYLAANKNFTYGGLNDYNTVRLLISAEDLPAGFNVDLDGYIVLDHKRYERVSFDNVFGACWILVARGVEGANPYARIVQPAYSRLELTQRVRYELN